MSITGKYKVNGDALRAEVFRKGFTLTGASNKLGFNESYLSGIIAAGQIAKNRPAVIEAILGIKPEKYVIDESAPVQEEMKLEGAKENTDGGMIRNIDVEFIKFRTRELGIRLKSFCDIMGKTDNYLYNLKVNGATRDDFERMLYVLRIDPNDARLFRKPEPVKEAAPEKGEAIDGRFNQAESKIAVLNRQVKELREENAELRRQLDGQKRLASAIVGSLAKVGIIVDGNADGKKGTKK